MIDPREIVTPMLGASASFAGLTLVFLGIVVTARQSYDATVPADVLRPYRVDGGFILGAFLAGVATVVINLLWLIAGGCGALGRVLKTCLAEKRLRQRYWPTRFGDLILDQLWKGLQDGQEGDQGQPGQRSS